MALAHTLPHTPLGSADFPAFVPPPVAAERIDRVLIAALRLKRPQGEHVRSSSSFATLLLQEWAWGKLSGADVQ
eukprot:8507346-Pyramimonas_sp.AAC.1